MLPRLAHSCHLATFLPSSAAVVTAAVATVSVLRSDSLVTRLLHVDPPLDASLLPSSPPSSPSTRRASLAPLRIFLSQALRRPAMRSDDGVSCADQLLSLRQLQPASISDMLAGFRA